MRLNKVKKLKTNLRRLKSKNIPQWVIKKTDRKAQYKGVKYSWRRQKIKL